MTTKCQPFMALKILLPNDITRIAGEAEVDRKTVVRYLSGEPCRPGSVARIKRAMKALGLDGGGK